MPTQTHAAGPPKMLAGRAERMRQALQQALSPSLLDIEDESAKHAGHAGARAGGETHYRVSIRSKMFAGLSRLERSRLVHGLLDAELAAGLHALVLSLRSPDEV